MSLVKTCWKTKVFKGCILYSFMPQHPSWTFWALVLAKVSKGGTCSPWPMMTLSTSISHLKCSHAFNAFAVTHLAKITARLSGHDSVLILAFSFIDTVNIVFSSASFKEYATYHKLLRTQMCVFDPHFDSQWKVVIILIRRSESSSRWLQKKIRRPINNVGLNRRRVFFFYIKSCQASGTNQKLRLQQRCGIKH